MISAVYFVAAWNEHTMLTQFF